MTAAKTIPPACNPDTLSECPDCGKTYHCDTKQSRRCAHKHFSGSATRCNQCKRAREKESADKRAAEKTEPDSGPAAPTDPVIVLQEWEHFGELLGYPPSRFARKLGRTPDYLRRIMATHAARRPTDPRPASFEAAWEREHAHAG